MARERRHKSRNKRRSRHPGLYKAVSAVAILAAVAAACVIFFRVDDVIITGNHRYSVEEILEVTGIETGDNLVSLSGRGVSRQLRSRLPYIQSVTVKKLLPDTVSITVTEAPAAAAIKGEEGWWLIGSDGKLLEQVSAAGAHATITGVTPLVPAVGTYLAVEDAQSQKLANLKELLAALEENGLLDKLEGIELEDDFSVRFTYDQHYAVELSATLENGMNYWLRRFAAALENPAVLEGENYTVDISDGKRLRFIPT